MRIILAALLVVGAAVSAQAQSHEDIQRAIEEILGERIKSMINEDLSCRYPSSSVMVSERGRAVQAYLHAQQAPDSPFKNGRIVAAREKALRLGGLVKVSKPEGYECRLEYGKNKDYILP